VKKIILIVIIILAGLSSMWIYKNTGGFLLLENKLGGGEDLGILWRKPIL